MTRIYRALLCALVLAVSLPTVAQAQLSFSLRTGDNAAGSQDMVYDSNKCTAAVPEGPRAMYVGGRVTNTGSTVATNVTATISGLGTNFQLAGGSPAALNLGSIAPGASAGAYWFVGYGCTNTVARPTVTISSNQGAVTRNLTITGTSTLSANATGFLESSIIGQGAVVGQTIAVDVGYSFGSTDIGNQFYLQPSGLNTFNAACFRLVGTDILSSTVGAATPGARDQLYFVQDRKQTTKTFVTVRYFFEYLCADATTQLRPYAMGTSGTQLKYTGNYDTAASTFTISFPGATNPFTITKTSSISQAPAGTNANVVYTVTINNPSAFSSRVSQFTDVLPAGAAYVGLTNASDVTAANSSSTPAAGATGTLNFVGRQDISYMIPAGGSVRLVYTVRMPSIAGQYVNRATGIFGSASTPEASNTFTVLAPAPLTLTKTSQIVRDPINGLSNPKRIPGSRTRYTIAVTNPGAFSIDANTIRLIDPTPAGLGLFVADLAAVGSGPVLFVDGSPTSKLGFTFGGLASQTDDVDFSRDGGTDWTYVPVPNPQGMDPAVTHVRIRPKGSMAPESSFALSFDYVLR
jgi:hypothetical protein